MDSALQADTAAGASSGLQRLEAAVAEHSEKLFTDVKTSKVDKLKLFSPDVMVWLASEQGNFTNTGHNKLAVTTHATFGRLKAEVMLSCTCTASDEASSATCSLHASEPSLADLVYEVTRHVHTVFTDNFVCFANILVDHTVAGSTLLTWRFGGWK